VLLAVLPHLVWVQYLELLRVLWQGPLLLHLYAFLVSIPVLRVGKQL
jgi:hypothetical protein